MMRGGRPSAARRTLEACLQQVDDWITAPELIERAQVGRANTYEVLRYLVKVGLVDARRLNSKSMVYRWQQAQEAEQEPPPLAQAPDTTMQEDRQVIEACLKQAKGWISAALLRERSQIIGPRFHDCIKSLRRAHLIRTRGEKLHVEYRWDPEQIEPRGSAWKIRQETAPAPAPWKAPVKREVEIVYPEGYQHQVVSSPLAERPTWRGTDWSAATTRPGCLDASRIGSRVGNQVNDYHHGHAIGCIDSAPERRPG